MVSFYNIFEILYIMRMIFLEFFEYLPKTDAAHVGRCDKLILGD